MFSGVTSSYRRRSLRRLLSAGSPAGSPGPRAGARALTPGEHGRRGLSPGGREAGIAGGTPRRTARTLPPGFTPTDMMVSCINPMTSREDLRLVGIRGLTGFEELRRYVKGGNEFCKEVAAIMQERSDLESSYAKAMSKLSNKLTKASTSCLGTLASAWSMVATEMETEAELHRSLGQALHDDISKPLKNLSETHSKTRKPAEALVDKALKSFMDKRDNEQRCKKTAQSVAKEREKNWEGLTNSKMGRGKNTSEKDITKLEKKVRQLDDGLRKSDREYHDACQKAEAARQEWETSVFKGSQQLQNLEEERISQMQDFMNKYNSHLSVTGPKLVKGCERLGEAVISIDVNADIRTVIDQKGTGPNQPEQMLCDYYAEDFSNQMEKERRRQALQNYLLYLQQDIEREIKGREGVERLMEVYHNRPNFADADAQEDARQRLTHVNAMLNFLEACHYKISCAVCQVEGRVEPHSKFSQYIEKNKDKSGMVVSVLRLPMSMTFDSYNGPDTGAAAYRGPADGGHVESYGTGRQASLSGSIGRQSSVSSGLGYERQSSAPTVKSYGRESSHSQPPSSTADDEDEFDTFDQSPTVMGQCRAIYDYAATQYDELTIKPGDMINIYDKQEDGWWQGELGGRVGIFPATYVEEFR